jgi:hypothetical protein
MDSNAKDALSALLVKSGFGQELTAAGIFYRTGWRVNLHAFFHDLDQSKAREIDLVADRSFRVEEPSCCSVDVEIAVELKSSREPFFLFRGAHSHLYHDLVPISWRYSTLKTDYESVTGAPYDIFRRSQLKPADFIVHRPGNSGDASQRLKTFGGLMQVLKASYHLQNKKISDDDEWQRWSDERLRRFRSKDRRYIFHEFSIALLVVDGPMYFVDQEFSFDKLDYGFRFQEAHCAVVPVRYSSPAYRFAHQPVIVSTLTHLPQLVADMSAEARTLVSRYGRYKQKETALPRLRPAPRRQRTDTTT